MTTTDIPSYLGRRCEKRIVDICAQTLSPGDPAEAEAKVIPQDSRGRELVDS